MLRSILLVGAGGAAGSILRFLVGIWIGKYNSGPYPWATFWVNITGSLAIGLLLGYFSRQPDQANLKLLLVTGLCGGFTTFSAFTAEHITLLQQGHQQLAMVYIFSSVVAGMLAAWLGLYLAR
ncbi:MAG: fluoride efflux transporter CrcB [Sphingobacteriales bacterium]|nr:MAG: fluoride efflux transporter CrcB [Sphingobacteriales bacterium]